MINQTSALLTHWLQGEALRILGWTLVHFLWEGLALALLLLAGLAFCRSAQARYTLGVCVLGAMLVVPLITFGALTQLPRGASVDPSLSHSIPASPTRTSAPALARSWPYAVSQPPPLPRNFPAWCACVWLMGVFIFSLRTLGGWLVVARLRRECTRSLPSHFVQQFRALERRLSLTRPICYLQSKLVDTPSVVGWLRPVVLLPLGAVTGLSPEQLEAVIAHELAHIRRLDGVVNLFQIAAETLFFYHPAIWWVNQIVRKEREKCCDDVSVQLCGNAVEYARALTLLESSRTPSAWALGATGGDLKARVLRLISPQPSAAASTLALGFLSVLCMTGVLLTAAALAKGNTRPVYVGGLAPQAPPHPLTLPTLPDPPAAVAEVPVSPAVPVPPIAPPDPAPVIASDPSDHAFAQAPPAPAPKAVSAEPESPSQPATSYIDGLKAAGLKDLTVDEIIQLKLQGITPAYIAQVRRNGFDPGIRDLIGMKVQGITPDYVNEVRGLGLNPTPQDLIAMKVQGIDAAYARAIQNSGLGEAKIRDLIALKVQAVTPEYIRRIRAAGLNPALRDLIGMKVMGVTPEYIQALQSAGLGELKVDEYIQAQAQGVTPEFLEKVKSHGFKNLTLRQLIALKNASVF